MKESIFWEFFSFARFETLKTEYCALKYYCWGKEKFTKCAKEGEMTRHLLLGSHGIC